MEGWSQVSFAAAFGFTASPSTSPVRCVATNTLQPPLLRAHKDFVRRKGGREFGQGRGGRIWTKGPPLVSNKRSVYS